eukprot:236854_1
MCSKSQHQSTSTIGMMTIHVHHSQDLNQLRNFIVIPTIAMPCSNTYLPPMELVLCRTIGIRIQILDILIDLNYSNHNNNTTYDQLDDYSDYAPPPRKRRRISDKREADELDAESEEKLIELSDTQREADTYSIHSNEQQQPNVAEVSNQSEEEESNDAQDQSVTESDKTAEQNRIDHELEDKVQYKPGGFAKHLEEKVLIIKHLTLNYPSSIGTVTLGLSFEQQLQVSISIWMEHHMEMIGLDVCGLDVFTFEEFCMNWVDLLDAEKFAVLELFYLLRLNKSFDVQTIWKAVCEKVYSYGKQRHRFI